MPKRVDHEKRRREIIQALWRIAAEGGLPAVTLRRVAAEAGVSMNLVQYYFTTKDQLICYGLEGIIEVAVARMTADIDAATGSGDPRAVLRAALVSQLPADEDSRQTSAVYYAYVLYAVTDQNVRELLSGIPRELASPLVPLVEKSQPEGIDPLIEVQSLIALTTGLAVSILIGSYTTGEAVAFIDYRLDRLFTA
ncbi:TetR/AcrR family transcriptional regulator [Amycolatopsis cihanbeyliensis]|uniref:TetR family transcriptional regulator n=1 Tax=Amycolatopsis cihanbeyliensis TaxID=1128664 RepID=A0A542CTT8_AMYCI|nr:TetR family transcriptional regulator C-terminal domain-containing protein [Amycolatopsis cihanbeyliensis]TQI94204.1 TetR family transcriptional regulator [Amycolatopsis cihanbeyliensis]